MGETETILKPETKTEKAVDNHGAYPKTHTPWSLTASPKTSQNPETGPRSVVWGRPEPNSNPKTKLKGG
jgi:hypothetical protein